MYDVLPKAPAFAGWPVPLCVQEKGSGEGQAPPLPSASRAKLLEGLLGGANGEVNGVSVVAVVAVPQESGFAIGARAPPVKLRIAFPSGCSGFSGKTVVTWPVAGLGVVSPLIRTETPYRADSASR